MIITTTKGKFDTFNYSLTGLDKAIIEIYDTFDFEDQNYSMSKAVAIFIPKDLVPNNLIHSAMPYRRTVENSFVSYRLDIHAHEDTYEFKVSFNYFLHLNKNRSDAGKQKVRDSVKDAFNDVNFSKVATKITEEHLQNLINLANETEEARVNQYYRVNAVTFSEELLIESDNEEWKYLTKQEQQLNQLLADLKARKAKLRKEVLVKQLDSDKRPFPENINKIVDDVLINADGVEPVRNRFF